MNQLTKRQKKDLNKLIGRLSIRGTLVNVDDFVMNYIAFESVSRMVWHFYRCRRKPKKEVRDMNIVEIKKSFTYFGYSIEENTVDNLISSKLVNRNQKSARNLRNALVHNWKENDYNEVVKRLSEFNMYFSEFFKVFRPEVPIGVISDESEEEWHRQNKGNESTITGRDEMNAQSFIESSIYNWIYQNLDLIGLDGNPLNVNISDIFKVVK